MLLSREDCLRLCESPAHAADLAVGRDLERRHRLHLGGDRQALTRFLTERKPSLLASPDAFATLLEVMSPASTTLLEGPVGLLNKPFTASGGTSYFEFTDPALAEDFQAFLGDTARTGETATEQFVALWKEQSLVGFQGVFLLDVRPDAGLTVGGVQQVPTGLPVPYFSYVGSSSIHDVEALGQRIEYLILVGTEPVTQLTEYFIWDDLYCHRVRTVDAQLVYQQALLAVHGLPYVPACFVTSLRHDAARPVIRTSPLAKALPRLDDYLQDYNWVRLGNAYHANPQKWAKGVTCDFTPPPPTEAEYAAGCYISACSGGYITRYTDGIGQQQLCPTCKGKGAYIPVGVDKVIIVQQATSKDDPEVLPVAGYVVPDLTSLKHLQEECDRGEEAIERAILGKSGILAMQSKAESGLKAMTDLSPLTDRLNARGNDSIVAEKFLVDGLARLRYSPENFTASQLTRGRRYHFYDADTIMAEFADAKKGGADAGMLYALLEDAIYAKFADDPMELQRNLLKLELTPVPHLTSKEALAQGYIGLDDLLLKDYLNDFFARFERENGSILDFGALIPHAAKIAAIQAQFTVYVTEKRAQERPAIVPGHYAVDATGAPVPAPGGGTAAAAA